VIMRAKDSASQLQMNMNIFFSPTPDI
jgi:hypothetical protein